MQKKIKERLKRHSLFILAANENDDENEDEVEDEKKMRKNWKSFFGACQHFSSSSLELSKLITQQQQQQHSKN